MQANAVPFSIMRMQRTHMACHKASKTLARICKQAVPHKASHCKQQFKIHKQCACKLQVKEKARVPSRGHGTSW